MSFREKTSWISLVLTLIGFGSYFVTLVYGETGGHAGHGYYIGYLIAVVVAITLIFIVSTAIVAAMAPDDANAALDERDRAISHRAAYFSYFLLVVGVLAAMASYHIGHGAFWLMNGLLGAIVLSEITRYIAQIILYRRN